MALPTSPTWNLADFNSATLGSMLTLGPGDVVITPTTTPYFSYTSDFKTLIARSDDGNLAQLEFKTGIPARFTVEFVVRFPFMPHNVGDLAQRRAGFTIADDAGRGISIYFASTGMAVSRVDDYGSVTALPDTANTTEEIASEFKTIRVAVDSGLGRAYVYISSGDVTSPAFRLIVPVEKTPDTVVDLFSFFVKGFPEQPSQVEIRRLQLAGTLLIPNFPPIADAGPDRVAPVGRAVRFDGRGSFDVEGAPLLYDWRVIDAPLGSIYAADISAGNTVDDGDGDTFTKTLSFAAGSLPSWVTVGDVVSIVGTRHVIETVDNPGGFLTVETETIPDNLTNQPFRIFRQSLLVGADTETPYVLGDVQGIYRFELRVNDGEIESEPSEVLANLVGARAPFGVEPDVSPIWNALGDEWKFIENRGVFEEGWRAAAQILGAKLLEAWQYHYNFSIRDAQGTFQKKWLPYRTLITETSPEDAVVSPRYGLLRATHAFNTGDPAVTGLNLVFEYHTGTTPTSVAEVTVTLTGDTLGTIISDCNAALAGLGIEAYSHAVTQDSGVYRHVDSSTGWTEDDGDGNRVTAIFRFTPVTLPSCVSVGDTLAVEGSRYVIAFVDDAAGTIGVETNNPADPYFTAGSTSEGIPDDLGFPGTITGTAVLGAGSFPPLVGNTLQLIIDGVTHNVVFSAAVVSTSTLIGEINTAVGDSVASINTANKLVITSTTKGPLSEVEVGAGTTAGVAAALGMPVGTINTGSGVGFRVWRHARLAFRSLTRGFRILSSSTAAATLGIQTDRYNYLDGLNGARVTDRTYFAGDGVSLTEFGVRRNDLLVLNNGQSFRVDRIVSGPDDALDGQRFLLFDELPLDATPEWELPSIVRSSEVDYEREATYPGDLVKAEVFDVDLGTTDDVRGTVVAQKGRAAAARLDGFYGFFAGADEQYDMRLLGVKRRKAIPIGEDVLSIPQLQDQIPVEADPTIWREHVEYILEPFYRDTDESPLPMLQFRDSTFIDPDTEPPDIFWAELVILSNEGNVENLFGRLVSFLRDDASLFDRDFNYVAGVAGLMFSQQRGPRVSAIEIGAQVLLGQPFAEVDGIITEIRTDFSPTRGRMIVQDDDGNDPSRSEIFRTYFYTKDPLDLTPTSGLDINPQTGVVWAAGDKIPQFSPIGAGVDILDIYNDPEWYFPFVRGGLITEIEKFHSFVVGFNLDLVTLSNLALLFQFIAQVKPTYTHPVVLGFRDAIEDLDVIDDFTGCWFMKLVDAPCGTGIAYSYDDYRGDGTLWSLFDDGVTYYDGTADCPLDIIEFCMDITFVDTAAVLRGSLSITGATYPGDFAGRTLELIFDGGAPVSVVFSGGVANAAAVAAEIDAAVGAAVATIGVGGELVLTSTTVGPSSSVEIGAATTAALLPIIGIYIGQKVVGNTIEYDSVFFADINVTDIGGVVGPPDGTFTPGQMFLPRYDMSLPAGAYQVCTFVKSAGVVLP